MTKSVAFSVVVLLIAAIFEAAILSNILFLPAVPDLLLLIIIYLSLLNGRGYGASTGFISGLIWDFLTGCPFGFNCLLRTLLGYFPGFFSQSLNFSGIFIPAAFGFFGTIAKVMVTWLISLFYPNIVINYDILSVSFIFELACNTVLAPFIFKMLSSFARHVALFDGDI